MRRMSLSEACASLFEGYAYLQETAIQPSKPLCLSVATESYRNQTRALQEGDEVFGGHDRQAQYT